MQECPEPSAFVVTKEPAVQLKQEAYSDMEFADCIKKHNGLVSEIRDKYLLIGED